MDAVYSVTSWRQAAVTNARRRSASSIRDASRGILRDGAYASIAWSSSPTKTDAFMEMFY